MSIRKAKTIKSYRVGNCVVDLRRKEKGKLGISDMYYIKRMYKNAGTGKEEFTQTFTREDMRDMLCLITVLIAQTVEITDYRED